MKEHISVSGCENTAGFVGWAGRRKDEDASIVKILLDAGAVLYARTTEPQGLVSNAPFTNLYWDANVTGHGIDRWQSRRKATSLVLL